VDPVSYLLLELTVLPVEQAVEQLEVLTVF
jgi:hypothetical protein